MKKIKYILKRISTMNFKNFFKTVKRVSIKSKKNIIFIFFDIIYCGLKYMAGYVDYEVFEFYNMTKKQRETVITRGINNKFVNLLNNKNFTKIIDNKILFNEKYSKFLNRDWINLNKTSFEEFKKYLKKKKVIIAKPIDLACGIGIKKIILFNTLTNNTLLNFFQLSSSKQILNSVNFDMSLDEILLILKNKFSTICIEDNKLKDLYNSLIEHKQFLLEDYVFQHSEMNRLYPESVNTLRLVTILKNNVPTVVFRSIRMGNSGNVVDNFNHGGLFTTIDENGIIQKPAVDKNQTIYEKHPYTNTPIVGFKIPLFKEAIDYAKQLALVTPEVGYTGWDICITENKPIVIEGNPFPGHDIYQSKIHLSEDGCGLLPYFKKILYS